MDSGILIKYSASAGSGKTTELTTKFVSKLFNSPYSYRKILAVTFTNKAAAEMKGRILKQLWQISSGQLKPEAERLSSLTRKSEEQIVSEAGRILVNILHDYSRFSVGTIDSFFQKVLKAFARESGLQSGYLIELDHSLILSEAVDNMLDEVSSDSTLLGWISEFAKSRVEDGKSWKIKEEITALAEELFREKFKLLPLSEKEKLRDRNLMADYVNELKLLRSRFSGHLGLSGQRIRHLLDKHGVTDDMFYQGRKGVPSFLRKLGVLMIDTSDPLNSYIQKALEDPPRWSTKPSSQLLSALDDGLGEEISGAIRFYNENFITVNTADAVLSNIYTLGILSDILDNVHAITTEENKFLLSDAGELLYLIIGSDQTPFIYEKIGNSFENYMIDEFQDTSTIQWDNFKPLIENSLGEGFDNLVVGDVKQSIYRWRNSDWKIFGKIINQEIGEKRIKVEGLDTNYRSRTNIIAFNNTLFSVIPEIIDNQFENEDFSLRELYSDARQNTGGKKDGGYINFEFVAESEEESFSKIVLSKLPGIIENLQDKGYKGSDIGILVRWNNEGSDILKYMLEYRSSVCEEKKQKYNYEFISSESLILDQNPVISFIISLLTWLFDPDDNISKALVFRNYLLASGKEISGADDLLLNQTEDMLNEFFPAGYDTLFNEIKHLSLFESVEKIISFFSLGDYHGNSAYLNSFQDYVLEFSASQSSEVSAFLEWWATSGVKKSMILSEQQDSIRVLTIHKSKGLQFRAVILPFLSWQIMQDKNPTIWITPGTAPFNKMGLVPVKYRKSLIWSHFAEDYFEERFSSVVDNVNLLYVAFTRAVDCMFGFFKDSPGNRSLTVGSVINDAFLGDKDIHTDKPSLILKQYFDTHRRTFSIGELAVRIKEMTDNPMSEVSMQGYKANVSLNRLRLKFHGENFLVSLPEEQAAKLNYGRLMHEVFSLITTSEDVHNAVVKLALEGKVTDIERDILEKRITELISSGEVAEWFEKSSSIIKETDILLPDGSTKRPDRIILKGDKAIIVDFKFGTEKSGYLYQVNNYRKLLNEMGYNRVEAFIWYVDINKIVKV
jgi:ATP-dependent helicase/nuclease subunit A